MDLPIAPPLSSESDGRPFAGAAPHAHDVVGKAAPLVAIKSWSALTAFGDLDETWDRLLAGRCIEDHARVAHVPDHRDRALRRAQAVASSVTDGGLDPGCAVVVGTSKGSVEEWITPPPDGTSDNPGRGLKTSGLADIAEQVLTDQGNSGPKLTVSAACVSGLHALIRGAMMIQSGEVRQALVVATEASVHPLFLGSFQRLGVLAKPGAGCRPFDRNRSGFYMSEAAAAVLLEAAEPDGSLQSRRAGIRHRRHPHLPVYIDGFAMGGDATHLTGGDPDARVLRHLLGRVIDGRPVDLIHAHGTGTELNDATELAALDDAVGEGWPEPPVVYSHKAALGHSLGASGLLSIVLNCICHTTSVIPPNVRTTHPLPARRVVIPATPTNRVVRRSLAVASGFGGPTAVVSLTGV